MDTAPALASATAQLLEGLTEGQSPLTTVSGSLAELAALLDAQQVIVAIDDAECGRQVFTSGRTPIADSVDLLWGPPRAATVPPTPLDPALSRLVVATVTMAFERARSSRPGSTRPDELIHTLRAATDRSTRYGWGFTLVVTRFDRDDEHVPREMEAQLRASDTLIDLGRGEVALLLPAAGGDEVPRILGRVGRPGAVSTFCYGLAACPGDSTEPATLLALATSRLRDVEKARVDQARADTDATPEVHALAPPKV